MSNRIYSMIWYRDIILYHIKQILLFSLFWRNENPQYIAHAWHNNVKSNTTIQNKWNCRYRNILCICSQSLTMKNCNAIFYSIVLSLKLFIYWLILFGLNIRNIHQESDIIVFEMQCMLQLMLLILALRTWCKSIFLLLFIRSGVVCARIWLW